jgi:hypothetical protein
MVVTVLAIISGIATLTDANVISSGGLLVGLPLPVLIALKFQILPKHHFHMPAPAYQALSGIPKRMHASVILLLPLYLILMKLV